MKSIIKKINESKPARKRSKYVIKFYVKGVGNDMKYSDNWETDVKNTPISKAEYWEVLDNSKWDFSECDALVAWHGKECYWGTVLRYTENPEDAPSYWNTSDIKDEEIKKIKSCEK